MWNYRFVKTIENKEPLIRMQEVYYDRRKRPYGHCNIAIQGETVEGCIKDVAWIMVGLTKPVLAYPDDFKGKEPDGKRSKSKSTGGSSDE